MTKVEFTKIPDIDDFPPLPDDEYECKLTAVEKSSTHAGDDMWKLTYEVQSEPYEGRLLWDNMVFAGKALARVKLICSSLGLDVSQDKELEPEMLIGKSCLVKVFTKEYEGKMRNDVPFNGYAMIEGDSPF